MHTGCWYVQSKYMFKFLLIYYNELLDVALKYLMAFKFSFEAYGEDNYETLQTMGEALEKKDTGDSSRWQEEM